MELSERFNAILKHYDVSLRKAATKTGVHISTLQKISWGETKQISGDTVDKICNVYRDINRDWLRFGDGQMFKTETPSENSQILNYALQRIKDLEQIIREKEEKEKLLMEKLSGGNKQISTISDLLLERTDEIGQDITKLTKEIAALKAKPAKELQKQH